MDATPTHHLFFCYLSTILCVIQIQLHSIKARPWRWLLNCLLEGCLQAALFSWAAGGSYLPVLILFSCHFPLPFPPLCLSVFPVLPPSPFLLSLSVPALLNVSSYVSDTFAKISWAAREEQQDSRLYVAYMNNRKLLHPFPCLA